MNLSSRFVVIFCLVTLRLVKCEESTFQIDYEDGYLTVPELITKYGYEVETHQVTTEDGYLLTMFRIAPLQQTSESNKPPVLLVHGILSSSADFVVIGPNNSLAYLLSDNGYDVWLANVRGSRYSTQHNTLPVGSEEYWDFSWHEIGYYDLPAMIDYVVNNTGVAKLHLVAFSQGTTACFVLTTTRPEYNEKITLLTALAPVTGLKRLRSPLAILILETIKSYRKLLNVYNFHPIFPHSQASHFLAASLCKQNEQLCRELTGQVVGPHPESYDNDATIAFLGHSPAGASVKQFIHYNQLYRSGRFRQFDYGRKANIRIYYGHQEPPVYNLTASSAPVQLYYGWNDWIVHPRNVRELARKLPNVVAVNLMADKKFNHYDFILGKSVREELYDKVIEELDKFNKIVDE